MANIKKIQLPSGSIYDIYDAGAARKEDLTSLKTEIKSEILGAAPEELNTLEELAAALGQDENFSTTVLNEIGNKVNKIEGKGLSTEDFTSEEKEKLSDINVYTQSDEPLNAPTGSLWIDTNVNVSDGFSLNEVKYVAQKLGEVEKEQARTNIGAVSKSGDTITGNLIVENSAPAIYTDNSTTGNRLRTFNSELGYGGLWDADPSESYVDISGKTVIGLPILSYNFTSKKITNLSMEPSVIKAVHTNDFYYKPGDTYTSKASEIIPGIVTGSTKRIWLQVGLPKSLTNISNITLNSLVGVFRSISGYVNNISETTTNWATLVDSTRDDKIIVNKVNDNHITISLIFPEALTNVTNNTPCNFGGTISLTFN